MGDVTEQMAQLRGWIQECVQCPLHRSRKRAVPGEGDVHASLMLVGEAPGKREDEQGRPFVGRSGEFLDGVLEELGLRRQDLYITSVARCRPPDNRNPHVAEAAICIGLWLDRQIALVDPDVVALLGRVAVGAVLGENGKLEQLHGQVRRREGRCFVITYHPAGAMRLPGARKRLRHDLSKAVDMIS